MAEIFTFKVWGKEFRLPVSGNGMFFTDYITVPNYIRHAMGVYSTSSILVRVDVKTSSVEVLFTEGSVGARVEKSFPSPLEAAVYLENLGPLGPAGSRVEWQGLTWLVSQNEGFMITWVPMTHVIYKGEERQVYCLNFREHGRPPQEEAVQIWTSYSAPGPVELVFQFYNLHEERRGIPGVINSAESVTIHFSGVRIPFESLEEALKWIREDRVVDHNKYYA